MSYVSPEQVEKARQMDLLTYLRAYEPDELVHFAGSTYCTREHDSLKISNGKWFWHSQGFGGYTALDYLIKVKGIPFVQAVERLAGQAAVLPSRASPNRQPPKEPKKSLLMPRANLSADRAVSYLRSRGIDPEIIDFCISTGRIYESYPHHNVVFVGKDTLGNPRYANLRGIGTKFKGEASGSDKRFSFCIPAQGSRTVHLFESAIDLLSYATLQKMAGNDWKQEHLLSLAGVYRPRKELKESSLPLALKQFLTDHGPIEKIVLRLDNDCAGKDAMNALYTMLSGNYEVTARLPARGKDYNDTLCMALGLPICQRKAAPQER